tara:strand:+ start:94 stop:588 length:495 start_codon:yes stop_codon:yes gene_type:complete
MLDEKKYAYDELVTKSERLKLNHDELSSSCNMKKILEHYHYYTWDQPYHGNLAQPLGNNNGLRSQLRAFKQICQNKMGTFGFIEDFKFNITFQTDFKEGEKWFLHFILSDNYSFVEPRMGHDICQRLLEFMEKYIELNFSWKKWFEKYENTKEENHLSSYMRWR